MIVSYIITIRVVGCAFYGDKPAEYQWCAMK